MSWRWRTASPPSSARSAPSRQSSVSNTSSATAWRGAPRHLPSCSSIRECVTRTRLDALALLPELAPDRVRIAPEHSELRGLELSAESRGQPWSWWAGYTWSEAFDEFRDVVVPRSWDQRHAFSGGLQWQRGPWGLGAAATVHSGWPTTRLLGGTAGSARLQARNGARTTTYGALDLRASWQRQLDAGRFNLVLEVTNATNRLNPCCGKLLAVADGAGGYSISTRTQHWLPLLPSLAALWEF